MLRDTAVAAVRLVLLVGLGLCERLRGLPMQIKEIAAHDVFHEATTALTAAHLCLQHRVDLCVVEPGFSVGVDGS
jgi:hypothetical protein